MMHRSMPNAEARLLFQPELARLAALHAIAADLEELSLCRGESRAAPDWRSYEYWDNRLHRVVAQATHNGVLLALLDSLETIRRAIAWGRLRRGPQRPAPDHHSFAEHDAIVDAIADRDPEAAARAVRPHLSSVRRNLLERPVGLVEAAALQLPTRSPAEPLAGG